MNSGVYEIINKVNGHRYIGSAVKFSVRLGNHKRYLRKGIHQNRHLQNAWDKHGKNNFNFNVLLICDKENNILYEQMCMDGMKPEYNLSPTASSPLGVKHTKEARRNMSVAAKKRTRKPLSEETKAKISAKLMGHKINVGRKFTEKQKANMSKAQTGKTHTPETRAKLSAANMGNKNMLGHKHTEESKEKMSIACKIAWAKRKMERGNE